MIAILCALWVPLAGWASDLRVATLHAELTRKGPGLLLRDLLRGEDEQVLALRDVVRQTTPDVLLLTKVDFDAERRTLAALKTWLGYEHAIAVAPNSMGLVPHDLDADGRDGDRQTWVRYAGEGAMALLSHVPITLEYHANHVTWAMMPNSKMPVDSDGRLFPSANALDAMTIVTQGLWVATAKPQDQRPVAFALFQHQTPVFDGPEDLNGLRNLAQLDLLRQVTDGQYGAFPEDHFVIMGNSNLDPDAGDGYRTAMGRFLSDPRWQDPKPKSAPGRANTAFWEKPGPMRVSYVLPSRDWSVVGSGVFWPSDGDFKSSAELASRHRLVWVDIRPAP